MAFTAPDQQHPNGDGAPVDESIPCAHDGCDRTFTTAHGMHMHQTIAHGAKRRQKPRTKRAKRDRVPSVAASARHSVEQTKRLAQGMQVLFPNGIADPATMIMWVDITREAMSNA